MKGKRAKARLKTVDDFAEGERIIYHMDGDDRTGKIILIERDLDSPIKIRLDKIEGEIVAITNNVDPEFLAHQMCSANGCLNMATKKDGLCDECRPQIMENEPTDIVLESDSEGATDDLIFDLKGGQEQQGFNQFGIKWNDNISAFKFSTSEGVQFYGWWRKTRQRNSDAITFAVDMYAKKRDVKGKDLEWPVESIYYTERDPRTDMRALNADICAAANKWFFQRLKGNGKTLDDLVKNAETPTIRINRLETIDRLLLTLREYRDTAIRCGGERLVCFHGDKDGPKVNLILDLTIQAIALEGKIPALLTGAVYDVALTGGRGGDKVRIEKQRASPENVKAITERLKACKDKTEARKLRGLLRSMGIKGGARGAAQTT